jgi:hypothetical protein
MFNRLRSSPDKQLSMTLLDGVNPDVAADHAYCLDSWIMGDFSLNTMDSAEPAHTWALLSAGG